MYAPLYLKACIFFVYFQTFTFLYFSDESLYYSTEGNKRLNFSPPTVVLFYVSG